MIGELLRSGSLGDAVRDAAVQSVLSAVRQGGDFKVNLPATAQGYATLRRAQFEGTGAGRVIAVLDGDIRVSNDKGNGFDQRIAGTVFVSGEQAEHYARSRASLAASSTFKQSKPS